MQDIIFYFIASVVVAGLLIELPLRSTRWAFRATVRRWQKYQRLQGLLREHAKGHKQ